MHSKTFLKTVKLLLLSILICYPASILASTITINEVDRGVRSTGDITHPDFDDHDYPMGTIHAEWDHTVEDASTGTFDREAYVYPILMYESSQFSNISVSENEMNISYDGVCKGMAACTWPDIEGEWPRVWNWLNVDFSLSQDANYFFDALAVQGYIERPALGTISLINSDTTETIFYYGLYQTYLAMEDIGTLGAGNYLFSINLYDTASCTRPNGLDVVANFHLATIPEPSTILLFGTGLAGLAAVGRRRK